MIPGLLLAFLLAFLPRQVDARGAMDVPPLEVFIEQVTNGESGVLRGVYVPGVLAGWVAPQPDDEPGFVSAAENTLTQFGLASRHGSTGLLAHNYLAGKSFFLMEKGQGFYLIYGDGRVETFIVTDLMHFKALDPGSVRSNFIDLDQGGILSASRLFTRIYDNPGQVILQTCIDANGNASWGRLFIIAEPFDASDPESTFGLAPLAPSVTLPD
jgi:hypothetical protein